MPNTSSVSRPAPSATPVDSFSLLPVHVTHVHVRPDLTPARLIIPKIKLNAPVLALGPDSHGAMQAPQVGGPNDPIWSMVYWWDVGPRPGETGNAVIAGHVNRPDASPATFTHLEDLVRGDRFEVVAMDGRVLTFVVTDKEAPLVSRHEGNDPTISRVFGPATTPDLNLITCWGDWVGKEFNRRLIIHSTLISISPLPASG